MSMRLGAWTLVLFGAGSALAAIDHRQALDKKINEYIARGTFVGGAAGDGFSLLNIKRGFIAESRLERIVLELGDLSGAPAKGPVAYFNATLELAPARLIVDLAQVQKTGLDPVRLKSIFATSPLVKAARLIYDPQDLSTTLVLDLKKPAELEVFKISSPEKQSRIVLDLRARSAKRNM